jgi:hypothetical protein
MSARRLSLVAALVVVPTILLGQRGGGGGVSSATQGTGVRTKIDADPVKPTRINGIPTSKELQKENMVNFVLDKKKDVKLSDDEVKALKSINDRLKDTVSAPMKSLDSIAGEMKRGGDMRAARVFAPQYVGEVRFQYEAFLKEALTKLSEEHQKAANDLIEARRKELAPPPDKPGL